MTPADLLAEAPPAGEPSPQDGPSETTPVVDVTVTIVTYQCRDMVLRCLETLEAGAGACSLEVVVVDNASTDGVADAVAEEFPDVTVLETGRNDGFGKAHNLGASRAAGRYLLVLNPDTLVEPGAIEAMVRFADERAEAGEPVGVVAPQLLNPDGTDQRTARAFPTMSAGLFGRRSPLTRWFPDNRWSRRFLMADRVPDGNPWTVDWVSGAAMLVPRELFADVGGFDPDFFMHFEDAELCHRVARHGRPTWCVPSARIVHDEGGSRGGWPVSQVWHFHHGAYLFAIKSGDLGRTDPRRWGTALLLTLRFGATVVLNQARRARR